MIMWMAAALAIGTPTLIYQDRGQAASVYFTQSSTNAVQFAAHLPAGWSFAIHVDGDQNGRWGVGTGMTKAGGPTGDRSFGQDSRGGIYCSQYIFTADAEDPSQIFMTSQCGVLPSKGHVELSGLDDQERATITIKMPAGELFGKLPTARIQVCVYDTKKMPCQHSLAAPLVLTRQ